MLCPFPLYQILLSSKIYSENFENFSAEKSTALRQQGGAEIPSDNKESLIFYNESKFVFNTLSAQNKSIQTPKESLRDPTGHAFSIILPNLIHKSRKKSLTR